MADVVAFRSLDLGDSVNGGFYVHKLTVSFRDRNDTHRSTEVTDEGRWTVEQRLEPATAPLQLPRPAPIIYSTRDPSLAELRDHRLHSFWLALFGIFTVCLSPLYGFICSPRGQELLTRTEHAPAPK